MADAADRADMEVEHATAEALARHKARQQRIAESMQPHVPGQPLDCTTCGEPIAAARLKALPFASRCFDCACIYEQQLRSMHG